LNHLSSCTPRCLLANAFRSQPATLRPASNSNSSYLFCVPLVRLSTFIKGRGLKVRGFWNDGIRKRNPYPPLSLEKGEAETMSVGRPLPLHSVERFGINAQQ